MKEGNIEVIGNQLRITYYEGEQKKGMVINLNHLSQLLFNGQKEEDNNRPKSPAEMRYINSKKNER